MGIKHLVLAAAIFGLTAVSAVAQQQQSAPLPTQGFLLKAVGTDTLAVTTTSARVALSSATSPTVWVTNTGASAACVNLGTSSVVAVLPCPVGKTVGPGQTLLFGIAGAADLAAITAVGTTSLTLHEGYLTPALAP